MSRPYRFRDLLRIARWIGRPCAGRRELLEHIIRGAGDYSVRDEIASRAEYRGQLLTLADALGKANQAFEALGLGAELHLRLAAARRGFGMPMVDCLADFADVADTAAEDILDGRERPARRRPLIEFIRHINDGLEHYAGWSLKCAAHDRVDFDALDDVRSADFYYGKSLELVKACLEPLGIHKSDAALAKDIERAIRTN
jgi:hypothetical protein